MRELFNDMALAAFGALIGGVEMAITLLLGR